MHDLNTINRLNEEAHAASVAKWQDAGKYVVVERVGLHVISATPHDTQREAAQAQSLRLGARIPGTIISLLAPTTGHTVPARDQSEDRCVSYPTADAYVAAIAA